MKLLKLKIQCAVFCKICQRHRTFFASDDRIFKCWKCYKDLQQEVLAKLGFKID